MPSSTYTDKENIKRIYKKLKVESCSGYSMKKPSFKSIHKDVEKFDNGKIVVFTKGGKWCELKK